MKGNRTEHILLAPSGGHISIARGRFVPAQDRRPGLAV
jgi:hypothetical protein